MPLVEAYENEIARLKNKKSQILENFNARSEMDKSLAETLHLRQEIKLRKESISISRSPKDASKNRVVINKELLRMRQQRCIAKKKEDSRWSK